MNVEDFVYFSLLRLNMSSNVPQKNVSTKKKKEFLKPSINFVVTSIERKRTKTLQQL